MSKYLFFLSCIIVGLSLSLNSCNDQTFSTDPSHHLTFSHDTLSFDTLFTSIPSRTKRVIIYNHNDQPLQINSVRLSGGEHSMFRYNLDGYVPPKSTLLTDITILANDSLFLFVETTLEETNASQPIYIQEMLEFHINGQKQEIVLESYGQDAIILREHSISRSLTFYADKPYLIFGYLHVPTGMTLTIEAGAKLYFHNKSDLIIDGNLVANGTLSAPVLLRGDRFDNSAPNSPYDHLPGQWGSIYLQNPEGDHLLNHTIVRNGTFGILLIGAPRATPTLTITNSMIHNMVNYGIHAQQANLILTNSEISNCGKACLNMIGGSLQVAHSTIANYTAGRTTASVTIANYGVSDNTLYTYPIESATIENSIIFGNYPNELRLMRDTVTHATYNLFISNCLIKGKQSDDVFLQNITWSYDQNQPNDKHALIDTVFMNTSIENIQEDGYFNFQLAFRSRARNIGNTSVAARYPIDRLGQNRLADGAPDLGAYER